MPPSIPDKSFQRYNITSGWQPAENRVIAETAVALSVNGEEWLSFTCTPADLDALAVGFLYNERIIQKRDELVVVDVRQQGSMVDVWLNHIAERPRQWQRTSGCTGGQTSVSLNINDHELSNSQVITDTACFNPLALIKGMEQLLEAQELYRESGGVHCSALSDGQEIRMRAEDIGRHNTLDKLAGRLLLNNVHISPAILLTTGRVSSEMLQKSARMGASVVVSRTSPTTQSVKMAEELGVTLVGYARRNGFIVYTHSERLSG